MPPRDAPSLRAGGTTAPDEAAGLVVRAHDAPGATLVVRVDRVPAGTLGLGRELARLDPRLRKIAFYGAAPDGSLRYRFVQVLPGGGFDFRAGCGHSLLACVVAEGRPGPVTVRALTTGDTVLCEPEPRRADAYTLHFLRPPDAPGTLPTGRPRDRLLGVPASLVSYGNPYVFVEAGRVRGQAHLLALRAEAARLLGHPPHSALPKIATVDATPDGLSVRALTVGGWHPRLALTGAAALAAAGALDGTVVPPVRGAVRTPGGTVTVSARPDRVSVHHKRATVLRTCPLPWRIHATA
ncbi:hypothetical protein GCM10017562_42560 [Streptomyces roseofulvus]|uniref:Proline racemase n=2 Tax=Streptomyces TaxID=1883 RepID=A0ABU4KD71_9ACTN|nr:hypothetical protein [Streptomyces roseolus]MDX2295719.1 hypothetical protein [Streptomyces roseolus]